MKVGISLKSMAAFSFPSSPSPAVPLNHLTLACTRQLTKIQGFSSAFGVLWCVGNPRLTRSSCGHERPAELENRFPVLAETCLTLHCCCKICPTSLTPGRTCSSPSAAPWLHLWLCFSSPCSTKGFLCSSTVWQHSASKQEMQTREAKRGRIPVLLSLLPACLNLFLCQAIWDNQCDFSAIVHLSQSFSFSFANGAPSHLPHFSSCDTSNGESSVAPRQRSANWL